jgi:hypothetical protein
MDAEDISLEIDAVIIRCGVEVKVCAPIEDVVQENGHLLGVSIGDAVVQCLTMDFEGLEPVFRRGDTVALTEAEGEELVLLATEMIGDHFKLVPPDDDEIET